jgi:hypothetical protein
MSMYVKVVEYIRKFDIKDISKFALDYNPLTKAHTFSRWDYTEENDNGITRPDIAVLNATSSIDWTVIEDELKMSSLLLPKHLPGDTFSDVKNRLYSWFVIATRTALDTERTIPLGFRCGNRLVADVDGNVNVDTSGGIIIKFSGFYRLTIGGESSWPSGQQPAGAVKLVCRHRQLPTADSTTRPPYSRIEHVVYETSIGTTTNKYFTFTVMRNFNRADMLQFRGSKTQGSSLLLSANVLVECFNVTMNQPYFRFNTATPAPAVPAATE